MPGNIISQYEFEQYLLDVRKFEEQLPKWVQILNRSLLRRLLVSVRFISKEQGMGILKASLSVIPDYYRLNADEKEMGILIGIDYYFKAFESRNDRNYCVFYEDLIISFLTYKEDLEYKAQRFYLLCFFIGSNSVYYYLIRSYSQRKERDVKELLKDLYKPYIKDYLNNITSYENFNKNYLYCLKNMYGEDRGELASLFKAHMRKYIISFMKNYPVSRLGQGDFFCTLFEDFNNKSWRTNMIEYLNSFSEEEKKEPEFIDYYKALTDSNRTHSN